MIAAAVLGATRAEEEEMVEGADFAWSEELETQAKSDFAEMDQDKDGYVTSEEVWKYVGESEEMKEEIENFFKKADSDNDGKITFDEYVAFIKALMAEYPMPDMDSFNPEDDELDLGDLDLDEEDEL